MSPNKRSAAERRAEIDERWREKSNIITDALRERQARHNEAMPGAPNPGLTAHNIENLLAQNGTPLPRVVIERVLERDARIEEVYQAPRYRVKLGVG